MTGVTLLFLMSTPLAPVTDKPTGRLDLEAGELKPGLIADYRSLDSPTATLSQIEPKPAFTLSRSSPHPRIPSGLFEVNWSGVLSIRDPGPISFSAFVGGELSVTMDGVIVLDGRGATETSQLNAKEKLIREPGDYRFTIRLRSLKDVPARIQLWWEGPSFAREVIPAWRFSHVAAELSPATRTEEQAAIFRALTGSGDDHEVDRKACELFAVQVGFEGRSASLRLQAPDAQHRITGLRLHAAPGAGAVGDQPHVEGLGGGKALHLHGKRAVGEIERQMAVGLREPS